MKYEYGYLLLGFILTLAFSTVVFGLLSETDLTKICAETLLIILTMTWLSVFINFLVKDYKSMQDENQK